MTFAVTTLIPAKMPEDFVERFGEFIQDVDPNTEDGRRKIIALEAFMRFLDKRRKAENAAMQGLVKSWDAIRKDLAPQLYDRIETEGEPSSTGGKQFRTPLGSIGRQLRPSQPKVEDPEKGIQYLRERHVDETILRPELGEEVDDLVRLRERGLVDIKVSLTTAGKKLLEEEFIVAERRLRESDEAGHDFVSDRNRADMEATGVKRADPQKVAQIAFRNESQKAEARELMTTVLEEFFAFQDAEAELEAMDPEMLADFERAIG